MQCQDYVLKCNFTEPACCTDQAQRLNWTKGAYVCVCVIVGTRGGKILLIQSLCGDSSSLWGQVPIRLSRMSMCIMFGTKLDYSTSTLYDL